MKEYQKAGLHQAEFYRDQGVVEWGVYKWVMRRARGEETRARWDRRMRKMLKEWMAQWEIRMKKPRRWRGAEQYTRRCWTGEKETRSGRAYCCVHRWGSGARGGRYKVRAGSGTMSTQIFWRDPIQSRVGQGYQCSRCTKEAGQVPWPVLRMTAWAFMTATMRTTDARGHWWGPVLRLPRDVQGEEEAQGGMEVSWEEEQEGKRRGVQIGWDTVRGLREEDDGVAVSFRKTDTG